MGLKRLSSEDQKRFTDMIKQAKLTVGGDIDQLSNEIVLSLISIESLGAGLEKAWRTNVSKSGVKKKSQFVGLLQQGTDTTTDVINHAKKRGFTLPLTTSFPPGVETYGSKVPKSMYCYGNPEIAIVSFLLFCDKYKKSHNFVPEYIAILWKAGIRSLGEYKKRLGKASGTTVEFAIEFGQLDASRSLAYLAGLWGGSPVIYLQRFQTYMKAYGAGDQLTDVLVPTETVDTLVKELGKEKGAISAAAMGGHISGSLLATPDEINSYMTPEELRKGIIAEIYHLNEWHLAMLGNPEGTAVDAQDKDNVDFEDQTQKVKKQEKSNNIDGGLEASKDLTNKRRAYIQSLIDAEFYRRRFASRNLPPTTGPFNPYPVPGFPGLIMNPGRPIIGFVRSVSHQINVAGASGNTSVAMDSPRYWDEGEVWFWLGGEAQGVGGEDETLWRRFPQWHNRNCVAETNYYTESARRVGKSRLDKFYNFFLGCDGIEYESNHRDKADNPETIAAALVTRDPGPFDVSPETLQIREYNKAIAETDDNGRFLPGTLAGQVYGSVRPYEDTDQIISIQEQQKYNERYGIREYDLLSEFLENEFRVMEYKGKKRGYWRGPTFGNFKQTNALQRDVLDYMADLEKRDLDGGY